MPIRAENRRRYPADWKAISYSIRQRARWVCEAEGCGARQYAPHPITGARVVLTVAHLDHTPENCDFANLRAWCQRCHNKYDAAHRHEGIRRRRHEAMNTLPLPLENIRERELEDRVGKPVGS